MERRRAALKALLAVGGFMRWTWVFVADMVLLGISGLSSLGTLLIVPSLGAGVTLLGPALVTAGLDLAGICLFAWMAVAVNRYGGRERAQLRVVDVAEAGR